MRATWGMWCQQRGISTDPDKVSAVRYWAAPTTTKDVQQFLGFVELYRRYIKNFSSIARPLNDLLKSTSESQWSEKEDTAFLTLKQKLLSAPILAYADYTLPFEVHPDASGSGLGAVLYQRQETIRTSHHGSNRINGAHALKAMSMESLHNSRSKVYL